MGTSTNPAPAVPVFVVDRVADRQVLYVEGPFGIGGYQINPDYCATVASAQRFQAYWKAKFGQDTVLSMNWPEGAFAPGSPFAQEGGSANDGMVPYLTLPDAVTPANGYMNMGGILLLYWMTNNTNADATMQKYLSQ